MSLSVGLAAGPAATVSAIMRDDPVSRWKRTLAGGCLAALILSCQQPIDPSGEPGPTAPRAAGHFRLEVTVADEAVPPPPSRSPCAVPIHGTAPAREGGPEVGLSVELAREGAAPVTALTDGDGVAAVTSAQAGGFWLDLVTADRLVRVGVGLTLDARRTVITGVVRPDVDDVDGDSDHVEWMMALEVLPEGGGDNRSATGRRTRFDLTVDGGRAAFHLGDGRSVLATIDGGGLVLREEEIADRDGDFVADVDDPDVDGDGILNDADAPALACPAFTHEQLAATGSKHASFTCDRCHRDDAPQPLWCRDCHDPGGRAWANTPTTTPADHFANSCEQCHAPDRPWAEPHGAVHPAVPIVGRHAQATCFACHVTGNLAGLPTTCAGCHLAAAPAGHETSQCEVCHSPTGWLPPTFSHGDFPLTGKHANLPCSSCHTGGTFGGLSPECSSCHQLPPAHLPTGGATCTVCHTVDGWVPARGHTGALPTSPFNYATWSERWFPVYPTPHQTALTCGQCHTRFAATGDLRFFSCTTTCHTDGASLNAIHTGNKYESKYYFSPTDPAASTAWPTAHVGCVKSNCHANGAVP
ncbi:MAG: cytochrome c family protein [Gemmatimonadales bacterium]|jgi:hypothetical protein|nr:cytochrome c family protein [Gemmatimonadales bacterium]